MFWEIMKKKIFARLTKAVSICSLAAVISSSANAATILQIDEGQGSFSVAPWFCTSNCNAEEQYQIVGSFEVAFDTDYPFIERIRFNPLDIETTLPQGEVFNFPDYPVEFENGQFSGNGDPCNFWIGPGSCYSIGNFGFYSGTFDGETLEMIGAAAKDSFYSYHYSINATVVPLPGSAVLFMSALLLLPAIAQKHKIA